jgi:ParB family chromosome partitioning protein
LKSNTIDISDEIIPIDINLIEPDPDQPRKLFNPETLTNLKNSIENASLQNPIFVRQNEQKSGFYLIVDGERRWRACKELNHAKIHCRIVSSDSDG